MHRRDAVYILSSLKVFLKRMKQKRPLKVHPSTYFVQLNWLWKVEFKSQPIYGYRNQTTTLIRFLQAINHFCYFIPCFIERFAFLIDHTSYRFFIKYLKKSVKNVLKQKNIQKYFVKFLQGCLLKTYIFLKYWNLSKYFSFINKVFTFKIIHFSFQKLYLLSILVKKQLGGGVGGGQGLSVQVLFLTCYLKAGPGFSLVLYISIQQFFNF